MLVADEPRLGWAYLGRRGYRETWELQEALRARVLAGDPSGECLLFVEHPPTITLGRSADPAHVLATIEDLEARGVPVIRTSRGGDVTFHGPGQLVVYPVVRLRSGLVGHLETIAGAIVSEVAARGVAGATWRRSPSGVWVGARKLAACGVHVGRRVAIHGFALNVGAVVSDGFRAIVPCGLAGVEVTSIEHELGRSPPSLDVLAASLALRLARAWRACPVRTQEFDCDPSITR